MKKNVCDVASAEKFDVKFIDDVKSKSLFDIEKSEFLDTVEAAAYLRTSVGSIRNATSNGKIPSSCYRKFGRRNIYIRSELRKLLLGQTE